MFKKFNSEQRIDRRAMIFQLTKQYLLAEIIMIIRCILHSTFATLLFIGYNTENTTRRTSNQAIS